MGPSTEDTLAYVGQQMKSIEDDLVRECLFRFGTSEPLEIVLALLGNMLSTEDEGATARDLGVCIFLLQRFRARQDTWLTIRM